MEDDSKLDESTKQQSVQQQNIPSRSVSTQISGELEEEEAEAFKIHLIVTQIQSHLKLVDLLVCRLVNHLWESLATQQILKRRLTQIQFNCQNPHQIVRHLPANKDTCNFTLTNLTALIAAKNESEISTSMWNPFPCDHFEFYSPIQLSLPAIQNVFNNNGQHIKILKLAIASPAHNPSNDLTDLADLLTRLLTQQCPNIECLTLRVCDDLNDYNFENCAFCLPSLKILDLSSPNQHLIAKFLTGAPYLVEFRNFSVENIDLFAKLGKVHLIKDYTEHFSTALFEKKLRQTFMGAQPKLRKFSAGWNNKLRNEEGREEVNMRENWREFCEILKSSQDTLEHLRLFPLEKEMEGIEFSALPKLKSMTVTVERGLSMRSRDGGIRTLPDYCPGRILPPGLKIPQIFPALRHMTLRLDKYTESSVNTYFPGKRPLIGQFESVTALSIFPVSAIRCEFSASFMKKLDTLFPNLKELNFGSFPCGDQLLKDIFVIWENSKLTSLSVESIDLEALEGDKNFDSVFTGICEEECERLRRIGIKINKSDIIRSKPSICGLVGLRNFNVNFKDGNSDASEKGIDWPITKVSFLYGFQKLDQLDVNIRYNDRTLDLNLF